MDKKLILAMVCLVMMGFLYGCNLVKYIPIETKVYVRDSVYVKDTMVQYKIEREVVRDYTGLLDTLVLETSYASSRAWVDTSRVTLAGEIKNREKVVDVPVQVKERIVVRDSIVREEVPVEVEKVVYKHWWYELYLWIWSLLTLLGIGMYIYGKVR